MFPRPKNSMKGKCYEHSGYKQRNKVGLKCNKVKSG